VSRQTAFLSLQSLGLRLRRIYLLRQSVLRIAQAIAGGRDIGLVRVEDFSDRFSTKEFAMDAMTGRQSQSAPGAGGALARLAVLLYGVTCYLIFLGTFLYAVGFVGGRIVPKTIDSGTPPPPISAIVINLILLTVFAVQHSGMARRGFKRVLISFVPPFIERSTYVLCTSLALILVFAFWQPLPTVVWSATNPSFAMAIASLSAIGWLIVLYSTFLISHFELFGLKQVVLNFAGRALPAAGFRTPGLYRLVRHPIYLGFIVAFWATPTMTVGHLLFALVTTAYIFIGIALEERDLVAAFGDEYRRYRTRVAMLLPRIF
jgi:protein-S-isoprenylcysteine O-methyltransferase Ste14